jgi:hypothetical protein
MTGLFDLFDHRAHTLARVASQHDLESSEDDPFGCGRAPFPLLHRGTTQKVKTVLWRPHDTHAVRVFDFRYLSDIGNDTVPSPLFTCATTLANAAWPYLSITPAPGNLGFGTRFDGHKDFDVLDQEFAAAFTVRTSDDQFATALLDVEMRRFLLDHARALDIEFNGAWAFAYAEHIPVDLVPNVFAFMDDLLAHIPRVVGELFVPPLKGDINTPMPDPGTLVGAQQNPAAESLDAFDIHDSSSTERLVSSVLGFNHSLPAFGYTGVASEAAQLAIDEDIISTQSWTDVESPILALEDPEDGDGPQYDLDGHPVRPERQDPWGPGRPLPHGSPSD